MACDTAKNLKIRQSLKFKAFNFGHNLKMKLAMYLLLAAKLRQIDSYMDSRRYI